MIPSPLVSVLLILAAYRLTRLAGWDEFPLAAKIRAWVTQESWTRTVDYSNIANQVTVHAGDPPVIGWPEQKEVKLPGKTPDSNVEDVRVAYGRPTLAHLIHCPFCIGWWISLLTYLAWLTAPTVTMYAAVPLAISGAVGLVAKNLDP